MASMQVVRFRDLVPSWTTAHAREEGFRRWLVTYVGGPEGYSNHNRDMAIVNDKVVVGFMGLPVGQRQYGVHKHAVTEIYIIVKGTVASVDGTGREEIAGPLDCIYIPPHTSHAVRNVGYEDVELLYYHDALEPLGTSIYEDAVPLPGTTPSDEEGRVRLVRFADLEPNWGSRHAREPGSLRWLVSWVAGDEGYPNNNREVAITNDQVNLGLMGVLPGNVQVAHKHPIGEVYVVYSGQFAVTIDGRSVILNPLDCLYVPPQTDHAVRCLGPETGMLVYLHDRLSLRETTIWAS